MIKGVRQELRIERAKGPTHTSPPIGIEQPADSKASPKGPKARPIPARQLESNGPRIPRRLRKGQRPDPYQPGPTAQVSARKTVQGLKARPIAMQQREPANVILQTVYFARFRKMDRAFSPRLVGWAVPWAVGPGWYEKGSVSRIVILGKNRNHCPISPVIGSDYTRRFRFLTTTSSLPP